MSRLSRKHVSRALALMNIVGWDLGKRCQELERLFVATRSEQRSWLNNKGIGVPIPSKQMVKGITLTEMTRKLQAQEPGCAIKQARYTGQFLLEMHPYKMSRRQMYAAMNAYYGDRRESCELGVFLNDKLLFARKLHCESGHILHTAQADYDVDLKTFKRIKRKFSAICRAPVTQWLEEHLHPICKQLAKHKLIENVYWHEWGSPRFPVWFRYVNPQTLQWEGVCFNDRTGIARWVEEEIQPILPDAEFISDLAQLTT